MIVHELDFTNPLDAVERLSDLPNVTFLDSAMRHDTLGRFSYVAADPFGSLFIRGGEASWNGRPIGGDPLTALKQLMAAYAQARVAELPPFQGGAAGFFAYGLGRILETLHAPSVCEQDYPDVVLHFYDVVLAYDHLLGRCWLISIGLGESDVAACATRARKRADQMLALLEKRLRRPAGATGNHVHALDSIQWASNFTRETYAGAVRNVIEHVLAGDIFQANISQRFTAALGPSFDPWAFYRRLRVLNPSTFAAYLQYDDITVASSSPERFLKVERDQVEARPIKGTASRSANPVEDRKRADRLLASEKDRAENLMIVDLLRNDLSRVCRPNTVRTPVLCALESYASVHHLVSVVTGMLEDGNDAVDLLRASFPGGSVTGAPKVRAMDVITEIERDARGLYCGSIGYLAFNGSADLNIAIRTVVISGGQAVFHVGGGITLLSDPASEYEETLAKAERIFQAFNVVAHSGAA